MARRMFALLDEDGSTVEYVSPAEEHSGHAYAARLARDPQHVEVDPETREPLQAKAAKPKTTEKAADSGAKTTEVK